MISNRGENDALLEDRGTALTLQSSDEGTEVRPTGSPQPSAFEDFSSKVHLPMPRKALVLLVGLIVWNICIWVLAGIWLSQYATTLSNALLAYTLGLRHAMDADHIAAIDNVTRRLVQDKQQPVAVGFFFALGHSTVVLLACIVLVVSLGTVKENLDSFSHTGSIIGTGVSAAFLLVVGALNAVSLAAIRQSMQSAGTAEILEEAPRLAGLCGRCLANTFRLVDRSWKMYPLGFLFGLGFDTSTEVSLLAISASESHGGAPLGLTLLLPVLFASAMTLVDSLDGIFMLGAYRYAAGDTRRRLYYAFVFTLLSVVFAFVIGLIQTLNFMALTMDLHGKFWNFTAAVGDSFGVIGILIFLFFASVWLGSIYFESRYTKIQQQQRRNENAFV